mmetsp:Transcript_26747/g.77118  ORF Transcript_26747/g.77118 Transcript_26747/m.77118 type:complete len:594 (-) Transcript_26747:624-2405(-)
MRISEKEGADGTRVRDRRCISHHANELIGRKGGIGRGIKEASAAAILVDGKDGQRRASVFVAITFGLHKLRADIATGRSAVLEEDHKLIAGVVLANLAQWNNGVDRRWRHLHVLRIERFAVRQPSQGLAGHRHAPTADALLPPKRFDRLPAISTSRIVELHIDAGQSSADNAGIMGDGPLGRLFLGTDPDLPPTAAAVLLLGHGGSIGRQCLTIQHLHLLEESRIDTLGPTLGHLEQIGQCLGNVLVRPRPVGEVIAPNGGINHERHAKDRVRCPGVRHHGMRLSEKTQRRVLDEIPLLVVDVRREHHRHLVINVLLPRGEDVVLDPQFGHAGLIGRGQIAHVVVAQMVGTGHDLGRQSHGADVLDRRGLELGLAGLEVGTQTIHTALLPGQLRQTTTQRILTPTVDKRTSLQHGRGGIDQTGGQRPTPLFLRQFHQLQQPEGRVASTPLHAEGTVGFDTGGPNHGGMTHHAVPPLEVANVGPHALERLTGRRRLPIGQRVGRLGVLTTSNEARIVVSPKHLGIVHLVPHRPDEVVVQYLVTEQRIAQLGRSDVPSADGRHGRVGQTADPVGVSHPAVDAALAELGDAAVVVG